MNSAADIHFSGVWGLLCDSSESGLRFIFVFFLVCENKKDYLCLYALLKKLVLLPLFGISSLYLIQYNSRHSLGRQSRKHETKVH